MHHLAMKSSSQDAGVNPVQRQLGFHLHVGQDQTQYRAVQVGPPGGDREQGIYPACMATPPETVGHFRTALIKYVKEKRMSTMAV